MQQFTLINKLSKASQLAHLNVDVMFCCHYQVDVSIVNGSFNMLDTSRPVTAAAQNLRKNLNIKTVE